MRAQRTHLYPMNRRFFIGTMSALVASPTLPAMAAPIAPHHMVTAKIIARSHNRCTTDMLIRHLRVAPDIAARIQAQLLRQGVITPPLAGVSMATNPTNTACITNEALKPTNLLQKAAQLRDRLDALADAPPQDREIHQQRDAKTLQATDSETSDGQVCTAGISKA